MKSNLRYAMTPAPETARPATGRVLVVDDNPLQLTGLRMYLERAGHDVVTAAGADEALREVSRSTPDAILSDVMMPDTDGFELCRALRRQPALRTVPVILVSGVYGDELDRRHAAHCGANLFLSRSAGPAAIAQALGRVLQAPVSRLEPLDDAILDAEHGSRVTGQLDRLARAQAEAARTIHTQEKFLAEIGSVAERLAGQDEPREFVNHFVAAGLAHVIVYRFDVAGRLQRAEQAGCEGLTDAAGRLFDEAEFFERVARQNQRLVLPEDDAPRGVLACLFAHGFRSAALLPLTCAAERFGLVLIMSRNADFTQDGSAVFAKAMASQASAILHLSRSRREIRETSEHLRAILNGIADGVFVTDGRFTVRDANPAMSRLTGYGRKARGSEMLSFVAPRARARMEGALQEYAETGSFKGDVPFVHRDGSERLARVTGHRVHADLYVNIVRDVTESQRHDEQLHRLAHTDMLTGLANRASFQKQLEEAIAAAEADGHAAGVLLLSLGNFREINDTLGPDGGDQVLRETAERLRDVSDDSTIVNARLGAAQFGILLPRLASTGALVRHAHVLLAVLAAPMTVDGIPIEVAPSIGSAHCAGDAVRANDLLRRAGVAMHHAGGERMAYAAYSPQHDRFSLSQLTLVSELRQAITGNQLELWYQPKLDVKTGQVDSVEALVRWRHPERGLLPPDEFIPAAERTGLIHPLTAWVVRTAVRQAKHWRDQGLQLNVAINISPQNLREDAFQTQILHALQTTGLPASCITLEITETAAMQDPKRVVATLGELRQHGLRISLDDFGTGQASLAHLQHLPVDEIKLDRSFVMNLPDSHSRSIAGATAMLAREFGLKSVAEGIETPDGQRLLSELGFDRIQGYHVSKPLPVPELEAWLRQR